MANLFASSKTTGTNANSNSTQGDLSKDFIVQNSPEDSIADVRFSPQSNHIAAASWDNTVRVYEIKQTRDSNCVAQFGHEGPVLNCCWSRDGQKVFGAGVDKAVRMLDLGAGAQQARQVAAHDQTIRCVEPFIINQSPMLITGSWDKTVKYWDLRQETPVATLDCKDRIYSMAVRNDKLLVIGTAERWIHIVDLSNPTKIFRTIQSPLKWQTRVVNTFIDGTGFAIGGTEGRCAFQYVEEKDASHNYSFKCHRQSPSNNKNISNIYAVNAISVHPEHGTFSTAGSDGTFHFWDKDRRHRLKGFPEVGGSITATDFSRNGDVFAYAVSYDWSKGYNFNTPQYPNKIMLHPVAGDECMPRSRPSNR